MEKKHNLTDITIIAFEDGYFPPQTKGYGSPYKTVLVATVFSNKEPQFFKATLISIDGLDATEKALKILNRVSPLARERIVILLGGITFAGFNIIDPVELYERSRIPVIVVSKDKPDNDRVRNALVKNFPDWKTRYNIIERFTHKASKLIELREYGRLYIRVLGLDEEEAIKIIRETQVTGGKPEPLREAKAIASAIARVYFKLRKAQEEIKEEK